MVAREVRRHRQAKGMSAQQLADACGEVGVSVQRSVIANFENGRRASIGVAEILAFAAALEVSPMELIFPAGYEPEIEALPGKMTDPYLAALWFSGEALRWDQGTKKSDEEGPVTPLYLIRALSDCLEILEIEHRAVAKYSAEVEQLKEQGEAAMLAERHARERWTATLKAHSELMASGNLHTEAQLERLELVGAEQKAALDSLTVIQERSSEYRVALQMLDHAEEDLKRSESEAREVIDQFRERGWMIPDLEKYSYLAEPLPVELPEKRRRLRRGKGS